MLLSTGLLVSGAHTRLIAGFNNDNRSGRREDLSFLALAKKLQVCTNLQTLSLFMTKSFMLLP
jgi:hypothetical protein